MAISSQFYPSAFADMFNSDLNSGDEYKLMLLTNSAAYSNANTDVSDVSANEITGTGYDAGGKVVTISAARNNAKTELTLSDVLFTSATFSFYKAVIYNVTSGALVMYLDFGGVQNVNGQNYQLNAPNPKPAITPTPI